MTDIRSLKDFDPAGHLNSDEAVAAFLEEAFQSGDARHIAHAVGIAAKAQGMTETARLSGIRREQLYQAFGENGNPTLQTLMPVLRALGVELSVTPIWREEV